MNDLILRRRFFAQEIEAVCDLSTPELVEALATIPREQFLPAGPWMIRTETDYFTGTGRRTRDADLSRIYHNS